MLQQRLPDIFEDAERLISPVLCQLPYSLNERPLTAEHSRNHDNVDIFNNHQTIIKPLPINQRVKNQQGVLLFSNKINEEAYPANLFDTSNTVSKIDEGSLSGLKSNSGLLKIAIPKDKITEIRNELDLYGFTKEFIYPEIMSFTEYMQEKIVSESRI